MNVIHIAAHLGAGAGKAISGLAVADINNRHEVVLLEQPEKTEHINRCLTHGIAVHICPDDLHLSLLMQSADTLVINWWHHPAMYPYLFKLKDIPARVVLKSHVNGLYYPVLSARFANCFDACLFTSAVSMKTSRWTIAERETLYDKSELVYGIGDFCPDAYPHKQRYLLNEPIRIGYVGSLDYAKMHPEFLRYCREVLCKGMNVQFLLAGDPVPAIIEDARRMGLTDRVLFLGYQENIPEFLKSLDLFIYLLHPNNFATTENALLEAMAAGLPIITGNSSVEQAIITDGEDGFTVDNSVGFSNKVFELLENDALRETIGKNARDTVLKRYNLQENIGRFSRSIAKVIHKSKTLHDFSAVVGCDPFAWFLAGCDEIERNCFLEAAACETDGTNWPVLRNRAQNFGEIFKGRSKGSVFQFSAHFPEDKNLKKLCMLYEQENVI